MGLLTISLFGFAMAFSDVLRKTFTANRQQRKDAAAETQSRQRERDKALIANRPAALKERDRLQELITTQQADIVLNQSKLDAVIASLNASNHSAFDRLVKSCPNETWQEQLRTLISSDLKKSFSLRREAGQKQLDSYGIEIGKVRAELAGLGKVENYRASEQEGIENKIIDCHERLEALATLKAGVEQELQKVATDIADHQAKVARLKERMASA